jgi:hypothetical protein
MSAGEQAAAVAGPIEGAGSQHREDTAVLVVADQRGGKRQALHAVTTRRSQRDERIKGQPGHRASLADLGEQGR